MKSERGGFRMQRRTQLLTACKGELKYRYSKDERLLRATWNALSPGS